MKKTIKYFLLSTLVLLMLIGFQVDADAQCSMCRMAANQGGQETAGLNNGILYLLLTPYILIGGIAYVWWRNRKKEGEERLKKTQAV